MTGPRIARILLIAAGYIVVARFSLLFVVQPEGVASFWPPSGYMLAAFLLLRGWEWRWMVLAFFVANASANVLGGNPLWSSLGFATANCVESLAAAWLMVVWLGRPLTMGRLGEVIGFVGFGPLLCNMFTALLGAAVATLASGAPFWDVWRVWWISESMGMLLVTPAILSWTGTGRRSLRSLPRRRLIEGGLIFGGMAAITWLVFSSKSQFLPALPYATFPFILWTAVRFGPRGGSLSSLLVAAIAVWHTAQGTGPFATAGDTLAFRVLSVQAFLSVATLCSLMLGALIEERRVAEDALRSAYSTLEVRIEERTRELSATNQALQTEVAERARAEHEVRRTVAELARSNAELEQYAYVASHDLQEPLRAVAGTVQLLQNRYQGKMDERADELIAHAVSGIVRMKALINDLLAYSRISSRDMMVRPTDCGAVMKEVLVNLAASIEDCDAEVKYGGLPTVVADPTQMTQLFQNLIGNAVKFRGDRRPEIRVEGERQDGEARFTVRDNGIGIEPQFLDRIFGVFQRLHTRSAYPGNGIGLAICKKIVERHGGRIWVESRVGEGSIFHFTIPLTQRKTERVA